jgi:putative thioredoxin
MATDVTDLTFETEVLARSDDTPIVIDLWAPWCGPCRTLGPILDAVVDETDGEVALVKVNVDENPQISAAFQVQSIPAVFAVHKRQVVDAFVGALPEDAVREFVGRLRRPPSEADELVALGDEPSLRAALELEPDHAGAIVALAELLVGSGATEEALALLARIPESAETRRIAALARLAADDGATTALRDGTVDARLGELLDRVKADEAARQEYLDLLEAMDPTDPSREQHRRALASRLF